MNCYYPSLKVYKNIICIIFFLLFAINGYGQGPDIVWAKTYGGTKGDFGNWIQQTINDGYIVVGGTYSSDGDVIGYHGGFGEDFWVVNLKDSNIVWEEALGGSADDIAYSVATTTDAGYIVAGHTFSIDGDVMGNHGGSDMWIVKLSSGGSIEWQKCLGGSMDEKAYSIQQTKDGGYIVAGSTLSDDGDVIRTRVPADSSQDMWIVKLDDTGKILWQKCLGGSYSEVAWSIAQTTDNGYIVAGSTNSDDGDVSGYHGTPNYNDDYWVVKLDDTGKITWQRCLGGSLDDQALSVQQTIDGAYIVAGSAYSNDGDVSGNHGGADTWVVKLTDTGIIWDRCYGGSSDDEPWSIQHTNDGGYLVSATTTSNDGDVSGNHGDQDYWLLKLASTGGIEWQKCIGGSYVDNANNAIECNDGSYAIVGWTLSFDGEVKGYRDSTFTDLDGDMWIVKLDKDTVTDTITSVATISMHDVIKVYPTIVKNGIVHINMPQGFEQAAIRVTNISGQVASVIGNNNNGIDRVINLNNLPDGEYVLQVLNAGKTYSYKVIVHKE
ncbi:MAG TPA: T9SS type A sorting domain-containing protein [Flavipsychrobacter sp.]|nr:T9SS type A sorting domain-containing protein [Flavipsychrobacter sp.]